MIQIKTCTLFNVLDANIGNVDTLLRRRQVEFCEEWNVLAKLSSLIDGKEF
jgi:hypothetical protein